MTVKDLEIQFHKETGKYSPNISYCKEITQSASSQEYIHWLENYLIGCLEAIDRIEIIAKG
jgi:hypothetical protein